MEHPMTIEIEAGASQLSVISRIVFLTNGIGLSDQAGNCSSPGRLCSFFTGLATLLQ
jgi:hypothetical protein